MYTQINRMSFSKFKFFFDIRKILHSHWNTSRTMILIYISLHTLQCHLAYDHALSVFYHAVQTHNDLVKYEIYPHLCLSKSHTMPQCQIPQDMTVHQDLDYKFSYHVCSMILMLSISALRMFVKLCEGPGQNPRF